MSVIKAYPKWVLAVAIFLFAGLFSVTFAASVIVQGELIKIANIQVDKARYLATFKNGTCFDLFDGCDSIDDFPMADSRVDFLKALAETLNSEQISPPQVTGCDRDDLLCYILMPYGFKDGLVINAVVSWGAPVVDEWIYFEELTILFDPKFTTLERDDFTFVFWRPERRIGRLQPWRTWEW